MIVFEIIPNAKGGVDINLSMATETFASTMHIGSAADGNAARTVIQNFIEGVKSAKVDIFEFDRNGFFFNPKVRK